METPSKVEFKRLLSKNEVWFRLKKYDIRKDKILKLGLALNEPRVNGG